MWIQGVEKGYEVIRQVEEGHEDGGWDRFLCLEKLGEDSARERAAARLMVRISGGEALYRYAPLVLELTGDPSFTDLTDYVLEGDSLYLIFEWPEGKGLTDWLGEGKDADLAWRYQVGRMVLERSLLKQVPPALLRDVLCHDGVWATGEGQAGFFYGMGEGCLDPCLFPELSDSLMEWFSLLFGRELEARSPDTGEGYYPEMERWMEGLSAGSWGDLLEVYQAYMEWLPATLEPRIEATQDAAQAAKTPPAKGHSVIGWMKKHREGIWKGVKRGAALLLCLAAAALLAKVGPVVWNRFAFPYIESRWLTKTAVSGDAGLDGYSGKVRILDPGTGEALWTGTMRQGRLEGEGCRYDGKGNLLYRGGIQNGLYHGEGELFSEDGSLLYRGSFSMGRFEGEGTAYQDEAVVGQGTYVQGILYDGEGVLRDRNGRVSYEGSIRQGKRDGEGRAYENGQLMYVGAFKDGFFEGQGVLYSPNTGNMIYQGAFEQGKLCGEGKLYEPGSGYLLYEGEFRLGEFDGEGTEYDSQGSLLYEGEFRLGTYHGYGAYYDTSTGLVAMEGVFRNGDLVTSREQLEEEKRAREQAGQETADGAKDEKDAGEMAESSDGMDREEEGAEAEASAAGPGGASGVTEPDGAAGAAGPDGAAGITEPGGAAGVTEPDGAAGVTESDGASGVTEPDGAAGVTEPGGAAGAAGPGEAAGVTDSGKAGGVTDSGKAAGVTEPDGAAGAAGPDGAAGVTESDGAADVTEADGAADASEPDGTGDAPKKDRSGSAIGQV